MLFCLGFCFLPSFFLKYFLCFLYISLVYYWTISQAPGTSLPLETLRCQRSDPVLLCGWGCELIALKGGTGLEGARTRTVMVDDTLPHSGYRYPAAGYPKNQTKEVGFRPAALGRLETSSNLFISAVAFDVAHHMQEQTNNTNQHPSPVPISHHIISDCRLSSCPRRNKPKIPRASELSEINTPSQQRLAAEIAETG